MHQNNLKIYIFKKKIIKRLSEFQTAPKALFDIKNHLTRLINS